MDSNVLKEHLNFTTRWNPVRDYIVMFYTYLLKSEKNGKFYTGSANGLRKRLKQHNDINLHTQEQRAMENNLL